MEDILLNWSGFLLMNQDTKINNKTYKKDGPEWIIEMFNQWTKNSDKGKKYIQQIKS